MLCNFYFTTSCSKAGMGVGRAPHHCLVNADGTRFPSEDSTAACANHTQGLGTQVCVLPPVLGSRSLLATQSKDVGQPRKPSAGTIKQCRAVSLSLSPALALGGFHHGDSQRAKSSARGTAGSGSPAVHRVLPRPRGNTRGM